MVNSTRMIELAEADYKKLKETGRKGERVMHFTGYLDGFVAGITEMHDHVEAERNKFTELCASGEASDGFHTFNELYAFRREYNAALVNTGVWPAHKSHRHHTGELCFGGGWFIVVIETPFGQISNHYEDLYWDEFQCEEKELADEWDGHTEKDVLERLMKCNKETSIAKFV